MITRVKASADAWVQLDRPSTNQGQTVLLGLNDLTGHRRISYISLARPPALLDASVREATLLVYVAGGAGAFDDAQHLQVRRIIEPWAESLITWNNKPATSTLNQATLTITDFENKQQAAVDVTDIFEDVAAGDPYWGLEVQVIGGTDNRGLYSSEFTDQTLRPVLELDWSLLPEGPTNLNPGGGRAVSVSLPMLSWQSIANEATSEREQAESQVQVSDSVSFTGGHVEYDSGMVANIRPRWDLADTAYDGLAPGDVRYWRGRITDDNGQVSDWSDIMEFQYITKGTLEILNPDSGGEVDDTTFDAEWLLSGRTQKSVEILLYQYRGLRKRLVWHRHQVTTDDTIVSMPKGKVKTGEEYQLEVRAWDTIHRIRTQGDPPYVRAVQDFNYQRAGGIDSVTNLAATQSGAAIVFTFERNTVPHAFCLVKDGVEVEDMLPASDLHISGDNYHYTYWGAIPGESSLYEMEAIELGGPGVGKKHSADNDTLNFTTRIIGIHLADPTDGIEVVLYGQEDGGLTIRRNGTTYDLPNRRDPVQVLAGMGGYSTTINGQLISQQGRKDMETLIGRTPADLRLIMADMNIQIQIEDGAPSPTPVGDGTQKYNAEFTYFQTGDYTFDVPGIAPVSAED